MEHIDRYLAMLEKSFGKPRKAVDLDALQRVYQKKKSVPDLVEAIAKLVFTKGMPRIQVGIYRKGAPTKSPAWVNPPTKIPRYGTDRFRNALFQMGLQASFIKEASFATLVFAVSHELAHIILDSVSYPLALNEKVVDLTAMHFGFAEAHLEGKTILERYWEVTEKQYGGIVGKVLDAFDRNAIVTKSYAETHRLGYLSVEEMYHACSVIMHSRIG